MGKRTGNPRGRPAGAKNKITIEREERIMEAAQVIEQALPDAFKGDAHALLMSVYKDISHPLPLRIDAAKAAISFEKPKLGSIELSGETTTNIVTDQPAPTPDEWTRAHADAGAPTAH